MTQNVTVRMTREGKFELADHAKLSELNPKEMLLFAAADCAGRTIISLLKDRRSAVKNFEIEMQGTLNTPTLVAESRYASFDVVYNIECRTLKEQIDISRAINLAHDKYCGLMQMLKLIAPVAHQIAITATDEVTA